MSLLTVNLSDSMLAANRRVQAKQNAHIVHQQSLDAEVAKLIADSRDEASQQELMATLGLSYKTAEAERVSTQRDRWAHLPQERIFSKEAIREVCIKYGLRFLSTSQYKGQLDEGIAPALEELKRLNRGTLPSWTNALGAPSGATSFMIAAPEESFVLTPRPKDPLLFCDLGQGQYYLVHKWGSDLSVFRRVSTFWARFKWMLTVPGLLGIGYLIASLAGKSDAIVMTVPMSMLVLLTGCLSCLLFSAIRQRDVEEIFGAVSSFCFGRSASKHWDSPYSD